MARELGISKTAIPHIWRAFALAPHQCKTFKLPVLSPFIDKFWDIVRMYCRPVLADVPKLEGSRK